MGPPSERVTRSILGNCAQPPTIGRSQTTGRRGRQGCRKLERHEPIPPSGFGPKRRGLRQPGRSHTTELDDLGDPPFYYFHRIHRDRHDGDRVGRAHGQPGG